MSGGLAMAASQCEREKVNGIQFGVFSSKQIKAHAVCRVYHDKILQNDRPMDGGLADQRMGSTDRVFPCKTCHMPHPECPGHFGYTDMPEPMFNIGLFDITYQALRCVCKNCGALLANREDSRYQETIMSTSGQARLQAMTKLCMGKRECKETKDEDGATFGCGALQPKIQRPTGLYPKLVFNYMDAEQQSQTQWHGVDVYNVLAKITDDDARAMGFNPDRCHPRDLLVSVLPIPPPQVRPSVSFGAHRSENELTHKLQKIIKACQKMTSEKDVGAGQEAIRETREILQEHLGTYIHNASTYYKPTKLTKSTALKSISERLKGKYGRVRGNLMGKRVDFSARTVITGDPCIDVDEVGVPYSVAMTLTFPEKVNEANKKRLTETVRREVYPSANYIIRGSGIVQKLALVKQRQNLNLEVGDVVERHVINGDVVLFNRQPTLHRMSMMGHRARVLPFNTFRLNLSCTSPYNADFDGDEMNLHVAQSLLTKAELIEMMMVPKNFVSPGKSQPCMGIVQDSLLGCFLMTNKETFIDRNFMQNIVMWLEGRWNSLPVPAIVKPEPVWTGKQVFTMLLPPVTHEGGGKLFSEDDSKLIIRKGELLQGQIKKSVVGASPNSLIQVIANEKGPDEVARFINFVQRTTTYFLYNVSHSVGVQDTVVDEDVHRDVDNVLKTTRDKIRRIAARANEGQLTRKTGMTLLKSFEHDVNKVMNECLSNSSKRALASLPRSNNFKKKIEAGSKGSELNICQIAVMVGQQNVMGGRIAFGFRRRTLPHFFQDDYGEASRGMVVHGYLRGLKPQEFYFHTMGGREGLIDTAVKTADTGYLQRKLIKALEDLHVTYDGTVRDANHDVVQMMYGEDGIEGSKVERDQPVDLIMKNNEAMANSYRFEYGEDGSFSDRVGGDYMPKNIKRALRATPDALLRLNEEYEQLVRDRDRMRDVMEITGDKVSVWLPVNVARLIRNAKADFKIRPLSVSDLSPLDIADSVKQLQNDLVQFFATHHRMANGHSSSSYCRERVEQAMGVFNMQLRSELASKRIIKEHRLSRTALDFLLGEIRSKFLQSLVPAGEVIGCIAAQSCGEPATQMTLNTFHNAGISSKNVTLGVPRLLELLNVSRNQRISSMTIHLKGSWSERANAEKAVHMVEYASLETLTRRFQIVYDPDPAQTVIAADAELVNSLWDTELFDDQEMEELNQLRESCSPWVARIELDARLVQDKEIDLEDVKSRIESHPAYGDQCPYFVEKSLSNAAQPVIRLRPRHNKGARDGEDPVETLKAEIPKLLSEIHLAGIPGVKKVLTEAFKEYVAQEGGGMGEQTTYVLDTEGTALKVVMGSVLDEHSESIVDHTRTASNNIPEVYRVLGIEAARRKLFLELRSVYIAYSAWINYRHYSVLVDAMCHRGYLMAVSRTGVNRGGSGPLMCASFEETVKILMGAAAFGAKDPSYGVSANILLGNQIPVGTGSFGLLLNQSTLRDAVPQAQATKAKGQVPDTYHGLSSIAMDHGAGPADFGGASPFMTDASVAHGSAGGSASAGGTSGGLHRLQGVEASATYAAESTGYGEGSAGYQPYDLSAVYNPSAQPSPMSAYHYPEAATEMSPYMSAYDPATADAAGYDLASAPYGGGVGHGLTGSSGAPSSFGHTVSPQSTAHGSSVFAEGQPGDTPVPAEPPAQ